MVKSYIFFFFKQKTAYEMRISDWSSDVCSSDLQRYGRTPEPATPYQRAGQMWDERIGSARVQARNWRLMAFGGLFLTTGLSSALVWQSMQSRVVPYVVAVDNLGEARAVAPVATDYRPTDPQIAWFLARFVADIRGKSRTEEHKSELPSIMSNSYAAFCLNKKK